ncbi:hypothetical protein J2X57_001976 [Luteibacter sp. 1214]|uniref:hypothetical protein n=1 Tax=Luteibacter sp. 1214 TaxID=2817735 RepID=UPI00285BB04E|nr:hypothetical protein [Luteibacter sp. 1214]MDR6642764.1 hypothetical protein [Luteibacter sp. 1214]
MKTLTIALAALLAGCCALMWWQHHDNTSLSAQLAAASTAAIAADFEASAARADVVRITAFVDRVRVVHDTTATLRQEIPRYVTPTADRRYLLPDGFVWLHDAAAAGVPEVDATGDPDAASEAVAASQALDIIVGNYGSCHETAEQLSALQDWVRGHVDPDMAPAR